MSQLIAEFLCDDRCDIAARTVSAHGNARWIDTNSQFSL